SPSYAEHLERRLARPVLYFSPLKFVVFAGRCPTPAACSYTAMLSRPWQMDAAAVAQLQQSDLLLLGQDSITTLKGGIITGRLPRQGAVLLNFVSPGELDG
ncbi:MAG: hypothetical protein PHF00_12520, partial [Elusimicrobia bacterium]|nr:hypothetical protein [Elusimicrobiota bacterium]